MPPGVAAGNPVTAEVGVQTLRDGGSAADAAVAMVLAACVAETVFTGLAGGGFATYYDAGSGETTCLDFFVAVPGLGGRRGAVPEEIAIDFGGQLVPYSVGPSTVAVPGIPAGVGGAAPALGTAPVEGRLRPRSAPRRARGRVRPAALEGAEHDRAGDAARRRARGSTPRDGQILPGGARLFHPGLDASVRALADDGAEAFYTGRVAEAMVAAIGEQGDLGHPDLSAYDVIEGKPQRRPPRRRRRARARQRPRRPARHHPGAGARRGRRGAGDAHGRRAAAATTARRHDECSGRRHGRQRLRRHDEPGPRLGRLAR